MTDLLHLDAGAIGTTRLVHDDADRFALLRRIASGFGRSLLAYCLMDTHVHLTVEASEPAARETLRVVLRAYARVFNARHGRTAGPLLRAPVASKKKHSTLELARTIRYDHENPVRTQPPIVEDALAFEWSSARAFAGFTRVPLVNLERARALLGDDARRVRVGRPRFADLEPSPFPGASIETLLAAVGQTYAFLPEEIASDRRSSSLNVPRGTFVALARLESYRDSQLAQALGRATQRVGQLSLSAEPTGVAIARTLLRTPALRARLRGFPLSKSESAGGSRG